MPRHPHGGWRFPVHRTRSNVVRCALRLTPTLMTADRHAFKTEMDEEAKRAMFPQNCSTAA